MSVYDFIYLLVDDRCNLIIYDLTSQEEIFNGPAFAAADEDVADLEIVSIDAPERTWSFTINVETGEDQEKYETIEDVENEF